MAEAPAKKIPSAETFVRFLMLAAKAVLVYDEKSATLKDLSERSKALLLEALSGKDSLTLHIQNQDLCVDETPLAKAEQREQLMRTLRRFGVRSVLFPSSATPEELLGVEKILATRENAPADTHVLLKLLTKHKIKNIRFAAFTSKMQTGEGLLDPASLEGTLQPDLSPEEKAFLIAQRSRADFLTLLTQLSSRLSLEKAERVHQLVEGFTHGSYGWNEFCQNLPLSWPELKAKEFPAGEKLSGLVAMTPEEQKALSLWHSADERPESSQALSLCATLLSESQTLESFEGLLLWIEKASPPLVGAGELSLLAKTYQELHRQIQTKSFGEEDKKRLESIRERLATPELMGLIVRSLAQHPPDGPEFQEQIGLLSAFQKISVSMLLKRLGEENERSVRKRLMLVLETMAKRTGPQAFLEKLDDPNWFVVRNMIAILASLRDSSTIEAVRAQLQHPDPRVAQEALRALSSMGGVPAEQVKTVMALIKLYPKTTQEPFKREILKALGDFKRPEALPFLESLAKTSLFGIFSKTIWQTMAQDAVQRIRGKR